MAPWQLPWGRRASSKALPQPWEEAERLNEPTARPRSPDVHPGAAPLGALPSLGPGMAVGPVMHRSAPRRGDDGGHGPASSAAQLFPAAPWVLVQLREKGLAGLGCWEKGRGALILFDSLVMVLIPSR